MVKILNFDNTIDKFYDSSYFINQGIVVNPSTADQIYFGSEVKNKLKIFKTYNFSNKDFYPLIVNSFNTLTNKLVFINIDGNEPEFVKNNIGITPTSTISIPDSFSNILSSYIFLDSNNDYYFTSYGTAARGMFSFFKFNVDNGVITELKRPAPPIAALGVSKGYWKAV